MTAHFHGTLADHYSGLLQTATDPVQRSLARQALRYHEKQYKKLNDYASHSTVLRVSKGNYVRSGKEEFI